ncbi:hypothetical protein HMPREF1983_01033 [Gemella bergeri ATCC 700627]|uniref:Phage-Barnase-EndoU-ColicinE5/D-RelE like nuclease 3 domain-containing protein n=1 Tax=Gemella bergeri ATCC 700627 TaxID=1321820 RepID=U2RVW2_9BACL|nr:hypothetical protein [Gemella bergeri]ERK57708.1 hypothetical protein HMPREF1983_01033 [Gemella bergeri ATCC 700627]
MEKFILTSKDIISKILIDDEIYKSLKNEFGNITSGNVILRKERLDHILERHPDLGDNKNFNTALFILNDEKNNINVVIKLSTSEKEYSIITAFRISDKRLKRVLGKTKILYNSQQIRYNDIKEE